MGRLSATAKYLHRDGQKFFARGISYGPFAPNSRGESYPEPERAAADLALMHELGANLIRTYTMPPPWLFELAGKYQLLLMPGISWPLHLTFLDSPEMTREIRETVQREVAALRPFKDLIFAYGLGNEIRSDIVRWHGPRQVSRFISELHDIGKQLDPEGFFTYCNYPSTEYLDLSFLDVISFNVYLHREPDFRRYLTHLMAITGDRPLVLSETGMDTIREGEQHQAELLQWQSRAAFELGLSGLVVFAFTDEWFRGGSEILDWSFGITSRERVPKAAFAPLQSIFRGSLPPPLTNSPSATVIVPAYNSAAHIGRCLSALKQLNYSDYEIIVIDDGSTDATAAIAEAAGVRTIRLAHSGLAAARNAGIEAARGQLVAFIDADAEAERDWLYHLAEAQIRRSAPAAGGQSFAPEPASRSAAVIGQAPGQPHEVRLGDQDLAQLCGCNMAVEKVSDHHQLFDAIFTSAGDDVDFSWRVRDEGMSLAYAPGAVVLHQPRTTIGGYLKQQLGYGHAEGLLYRKFPNRAQDGVYRHFGWLPNWLGAGQRIYYGVFGRGLFQTIYPGLPEAPATLVPLTFPWVAAAIVLMILGISNRIFTAFGVIGVSVTIFCACAGAIVAGHTVTGFTNRALLALLWLLGPLVRNYERERVKWSFRPDTRGGTLPAATALRGTIPLQSPGLALPQMRPEAAADADAVEERIAALHLALIRRGLIVARGTSYDSYDLQIIVPPWIRIAVLSLAGGGSFGWRTSIAAGRLGLTLATLLLLFLLSGLSLLSAITAMLGGGAMILLLGWIRARRVPVVISAAAAHISRWSVTAEQNH
jgi:glycosyltransferase involved in cell wall biosynthesis